MPTRPLVAPARERRRLVLPSLLGAAALVLLVAVVGSIYVRRGEQPGGGAAIPALGRPAGSPLAVPTAAIPGASAVATIITAPTGSGARSSPAGALATIPVAPTVPTVTPTPAPTVPPLPPVLVDEFGDPASGFPRNPGGQEQPAYWEGEYRIVVAQPDGLNIAELDRPPDFREFGDLVLEADIKVVGPASGGSYGFVFHRQVSGDTINQYFVLIDPDAGTIRLVFWAGAQRTELLPPTPHAAIARGNATNRLSVTCKGPLITLHVNGVQVFQVTGPGPQRGVIGLRADAGAAPIEVHFDNVVIRPAR